MSDYECSYCPFGTNDPWVMLSHRDTHRDHPEVVAGTARVNALLAALPRSSGAGTHADVCSEPLCPEHRADRATSPSHDTDRSTE